MLYEFYPNIFQQASEYIITSYRIYYDTFSEYIKGYIFGILYKAKEYYRIFTI